jgi:hypothetical protein
MGCAVIGRDGLGCMGGRDDRGRGFDSHQLNCVLSFLSFFYCAICLFYFSYFLLSSFVFILSYFYIFIFLYFRFQISDLYIYIFVYFIFVYLYICIFHICIFHICIFHICIFHICIFHICIFHICIFHICIFTYLYIFFKCSVNEQYAFRQEDVSYNKNGYEASQ